MMLLDNATFSGFVANLIRANVTYLFFNLPNMNTSGYVADNFSQESALISRFDSLRGNHTFEYFGWTGTQIDPTDVLGNFTDPSIITDVSSIYQAGFQGILIDMEPVPNDSPQFLSMLQDLKQAMSQEPTKMLLAANSMKVGYGATPGQEWTWDPTYFRNVTKLVDFVIPMLFETGTTTQYSYEQYSKQQIQLSTQYSSAPVLYSIPDWYANSTWHHPYAENLTNAVITFSALIASGTKLPNMIGLGIYALNKTYVLGQGPPTQGLETTSYDWAYYINNWTNTSYPMKIGTAYG